MRILIDGDGCPKLVKNAAIHFGEKLNISTLVYTTYAHVGNTIEDNCIILDSHWQSVDIKLANDTKKGDIVITQDYGLASMILAKGGHPIGVRGEIFTSENIDRYLLIRHQNQKIRDAGLLRGGPSKFGKTHLEAFKTGLANLVEKNQKNKRVFLKSGE